MEGGVLRILVTLLTLLTGLTGATVKLAWDANPPAQNVVAYDLKAWEVFGTQEVVVSATEPVAEVSGLKAGVEYFFAVRARNADGLASAYSPAIMGTPVARLRLTIQRGTDLQGWADTDAVLTVPMREKEFFRLKVEVEP